MAGSRMKLRCKADASSFSPVASQDTAVAFYKVSLIFIPNFPSMVLLHDHLFSTAQYNTTFLHFMLIMRTKGEFTEKNRQAKE